MPYLVRIGNDMHSEQARVLGIDFYSVFSRGSQFKVESLMVRIAKAECLMLVSPSRKQVKNPHAVSVVNTR